jgi:FlaA1/EpsC-like NDP-sugar epimerase
MSIDEAVTLIENSASVMQGGERYIPRLPAFRLADLAEAMGIEYDVVGLPEWEKQHEGMDDDNTSDQARRMTVDEIRQRLLEVT